MSSNYYTIGLIAWPDDRSDMVLYKRCIVILYASMTMKTTSISRVLYTFKILVGIHEYINIQQSYTYAHLFILVHRFEVSVFTCVAKNEQNYTLKLE